MANYAVGTTDLGIVSVMPIRRVKIDPAGVTEVAKINDSTKELTAGTRTNAVDIALLLRWQRAKKTRLSPLTCVLEFLNVFAERTPKHTSCRYVGVWSSSVVVSMCV